MRALATVAALAAGGLLAACGGGAPPAPADQTAPLEALPDCTDIPTEAAEAPEGFTAPEGTIVVQVTPQDPLVNVVGYLKMTPTEVRLAYEALDGIQLLLSEDEVFEAELLVSDGDHRTYVKATAACKRGSHLLAVVAPEVSASGLPVPQGAASATPAP